MKSKFNWHVRFAQQAGWTRILRGHLYKRANLGTARAILEVGCGTGAILDNLPAFTQAHIHALDLDYDRLIEAGKHAPTARLVNADANALPYPDGFFDACLCHFLLLWVDNPLQVLIEMRRVTRTGGAVLVMAEPDYSRRVDSPQELVRLGQLQTLSLRKQGADPAIGAQLPVLFTQAGINLEETGLLQSSLPGDFDEQDWELEWLVLESDLAGFLSEEDLTNLKQLDRESRLKGVRRLFVPTHFAWGRV